MQKALMEVIKECSKEMKEKENDWIFCLSINYFYDGESVDLGVRIAVCDSKGEDFRFVYHSFILEHDKIEECILEYLRKEGAENVYARLKMLAGELKEGLLNCSWVDSRTVVEIIEYD